MTEIIRRTFRRHEDEWWDTIGCTICGERFALWFDVPEDVQLIDISLHDEPDVDREKVKIAKTPEGSLCVRPTRRGIQLTGDAAIVEWGSCLGRL